MPQEYVTVDHLDEVLERVAASHTRVAELHREVAQRAHDEHRAATAAADTSGGGGDGSGSAP